MPMRYLCRWRLVPKKNFKGVVDLVKNKAILWNEDDQGMTFEYGMCPADMADQVEECASTWWKLPLKLDETDGQVSRRR